MASNIVKAIPLTSRNANTLNGNLQAINPNGLPFPCTMLHIVNTSNVNVTIGINGVQADVVLSQTDLFLPFQANAIPEGQTAMLPKGTVISVLSNTGGAGAGTVFLAGYHQDAT